MLPALAAHAIATYSAPGGLVLDPMCGAGTTLVEAVHAARHAIGVDLELRFTLRTRCEAAAR
jgi:DNA modification methylase